MQCIVMTAQRVVPFMYVGTDCIRQVSNILHGAELAERQLPSFIARVSGATTPLLTRDSPIMAMIGAPVGSHNYLVLLRDTEKTKNVAELAICLLRLVASSIPTYWMRIMPPEQTAAAAAYVDSAILERSRNALGAALELASGSPVCVRRPDAGRP